MNQIHSVRPLLKRVRSDGSSGSVVDVKNKKYPLGLLSLLAKLI